MDPRPRQPAPGPPPGGDDLDRTDELPALDPAAFEAAAREHPDRTESWNMPRPAPRAAPTAPAVPGPSAEPAAAADDPLQTAADNLREALALLAGRGEQLAQAEASLEEARSGAAAAERRAVQLAGELQGARASAAEREAGLGAELAAARADAERSRAEAAGREARLGEELAQARAAAGQQASQLAENLAKARAESEERVRAVRAAADDAQRSRELQNAKAIGARDRAHLAMQAHIDELRARSASYLEALQSAEYRRALLAGLLAELGDAAEAREARHARLAGELAGQQRRGAELEAQLKQSAARIATLEGEAGSFTATLAARDRELARLQGGQASLTAMLESARAATSAADGRAAEHEASLAESRERVGALEAQLAAAGKSLAEREQELTAVRGEMQEWAGALQAAQLERNAQLASASASDSRARQLEERAAEQAEKLRALQSAAEAAVARARELEADLHAAEDSIARLESQLRGGKARVSELEKANQQWRLTLAEARAAGAGRTDTQAGDGRGAGEAATRAAGAEAGTRLLIRSDGGREIVHVLGRKTTIGRTPDNDLRIDAKYISRHHAVILATPAHTIIEDLNSTNGVVVNGRRVTRQFLNDGDKVVVGRTPYRFAVRRGGDQH